MLFHIALSCDNLGKENAFLGDHDPRTAEALKVLGPEMKMFSFVTCVTVLGEEK